MPRFWKLKRSQSYRQKNERQKNTSVACFSYFSVLNFSVYLFDSRQDVFDHMCFFFDTRQTLVETLELECPSFMVNPQAMQNRGV